MTLLPSCFFIFEQVLSFTPGFSPVFSKVSDQKPFQRFPFGKARKPLKRLQGLVAILAPG
jgi:hypothetical protein